MSTVFIVFRRLYAALTLASVELCITGHGLSITCGAGVIGVIGVTGAPASGAGIGGSNMPAPSCSTNGTGSGVAGARCEGCAGAADVSGAVLVAIFVLALVSVPMVFSSFAGGSGASLHLPGILLCSRSGPPCLHLRQDQRT